MWCSFARNATLCVEWRHYYCAIFHHDNRRSTLNARSDCWCRELLFCIFFLNHFIESMLNFHTEYIIVMWISFMMWTYVWYSVVFVRKKQNNSEKTQQIYNEKCENYDVVLWHNKITQSDSDKYDWISNFHWNRI